MKREKPNIELLPPIKGGVSGCLNCGYTASILPMRTRLYYSFGGWTITRNGEPFFMDIVERRFDKYKTLTFIEKQARLDPTNDWRAELNLPLRSATYQRQGNNWWVLVERGRGFA